MQATVTDDMELVLRWQEHGESEVRFALASASEFTIAVHLCWEQGFNYQGQVAITFQTCCYGHDLAAFESQLRKLAQGNAESARFRNTGGDFELRIVPRERNSRRILLSELRYRHYRAIADVACDSELVLPVGEAEDVLRSAEAIGEVIRLLKVDCRNLFESPK